MERQTPANNRRLGTQDVEYVLKSAKSDRSIANELGVVHVVISNIRNGKTYGEIRPDLPRRTNKRCPMCVHWQYSKCTFGFPEPKKEGHLFAAFCSYFEEKPPLNKDGSLLSPAFPASPD